MDITTSYRSRKADIEASLL